MTSVSQLLPNFIQGINEQPDELKKPGQVRDAVNVYPDVTKGLMKRTGYELIVDPDTTTNGTWFSVVRRNDRDQKRYIFNVNRDGLIKGWDADTGDEQEILMTDDVINLGEGQSAFDSATTTALTEIEYLKTLGDYSIKTATLADTVFVCNSEERASMGSSALTERPYEAYIELKVLDVTRSYNLNFDRVGSNAVSQTFATKVDYVKNENFFRAGFTEACGAVGSYNLSTSVATNRKYYDGTTPDDDGTRVGPIQVRITVVAAPSLTDGNEVNCRYRVSDTRLLSGGEGWKEGDRFMVALPQLVNNLQMEAYYEVTETVTTSGPLDVVNIGVTPDTDDGSIFPLLESLASEIVNRTDLEDENIEIIGNGLYVKDDEPFKFDTNEGDLFNILNNQAEEVNGEYPNPIAVVNNVSNLPLECKQGFVCKVQNSFVEEDDYFVRFVRDYGDIGSSTATPGSRYVESGMGYWVEVAKPGEHVTLDSGSLPMVLRYRPLTDDWVIANVAYSDRTCGTEDQFTPSFVNNRINNVMFYRNRLVFISDSSVVTSQAGDFTNFFPATALTVSPSDPVDVEATSDYTANLYAGLQINNALLLFGEYNQFLLTTDSDIFSPSTAKVSQVASYKFDTNSEPFMIGTNVGFLGGNDDSTSMYEMTNIFREGQTDVVEKSKLVSNTMVEGYSMSSSSRDTGLVTLGKKGSDTIWLYKYFKENSQSDIQQAWFKWTLPGNVYYQFLENNKHYVITDGGKIYRNDMDGNIYQDDGVDYEMKVTLPTFYVTKTEQQAYRADTTASLVIHRMYLNTGEANYYTINIDRYGKDPYVVDYEQSIQDAYLADATPITIEREQSIPLYERNTNLDISITSNFDGPFTLYSLRWEGDYNPKYYNRV